MRLRPCIERNCSRNAREKHKRRATANELQATRESIEDFLTFSLPWLPWKPFHDSCDFLFDPWLRNQSCRRSHTRPCPSRSTSQLRSSFLVRSPHKFPCSESVGCEFRKWPPWSNLVDNEFVYGGFPEPQGNKTETAREFPQGLVIVNSQPRSWDILMFVSKQSQRQGFTFQLLIVLNVLVIEQNNEYSRALWFCCIVGCLCGDNKQQNLITLKHPIVQAAIRLQLAPIGYTTVLLSMLLCSVCYFLCFCRWLVSAVHVQSFGSWGQFKPQAGSLGFMLDSCFNHLISVLTSCVTSCLMPSWCECEGKLLTGILSSINLVFSSP